MLNLNQGSAFINTDLDESIISDHAEIQYIIQPGLGITTFNISNPNYHKYFKENASFKHTNLATTFTDTNPWYMSKETNTIDRIIQHTTNLGIYVIVEGYYKLYKQLTDKLTDNFYLLKTPELKTLLDSKNSTHTQNITSILINEDKFKIITEGLVSQAYSESSKKCQLVVPWIALEATDLKLIIAGIHVPGCAEQFPKSGITELNNILKKLALTYPEYKIIAAGDFNTAPSNSTTLIENLKLIPPAYFTHMNPNCEIGSYDQIYCSDPTLLSQVPTELMSADTQKFVGALVTRLC